MPRKLLTSVTMCDIVWLQMSTIHGSVVDMNIKQIALTEAEWMVMECLWEKSPRTGRETVEWLNQKMG